VTFGGVEDRVTSAGVDLTLDTRTDPAFPRNAVLARAVWRASSFRSAPRMAHTYTLEGRGYVGLIGQMVLAVRALYEGAGEALPAFAQPLLGGGATLRGHRAGAYAGDQLAASSIELRVPLDSPMGLGRAGVKVFLDTGAVFAAGTSLRDATFHQGVGGGVFLSAPLVRFDLDVGHDLHHGARVHVAAGVSF
jgi:hemolysin activation/secretion protein